MQYQLLVVGGWARKVGLAAILVSLVGWLIFIVCFAGFNYEDNFYNDIRKNGRLNFANPVTVPVRMNGTTVLVNTTRVPVVAAGLLSDQDIKEDFPLHRADADGLIYYVFSCIHPLAVICAVSHTAFDLPRPPGSVPVLSLTAHVLLALSLVCGAGAFWSDGSRLFSSDNNLRNTFSPTAVSDDWLYDRYWGSWLVAEWVGLLVTGISALVYFAVAPFFKKCRWEARRRGVDDETGASADVTIELDLGGSVIV